MHVDLASLHIVRYPDPVLRRKTRPIASIDETVRAVARRMLELMHEAPGVGLAGPQVGLSWRLFVTNAGDLDPVDRVFINPELALGRVEMEVATEGCLSLREIDVEVRRPVHADITATGLDGERFSISADELLARIWQHENDHLDGVLIVDRMSQMDRLSTRRALKEMREAAGIADE